MRTTTTEMPCGHVVAPDPDRADWCSECERLQAIEITERDKIVIYNTAVCYAVALRALQAGQTDKARRLAAEGSLTAWAASDAIYARARVLGDAIREIAIARCQKP